MMKGSDRMNGLLSVIIPAYNEQEMIPKAAATIAEILEQAEISYELLFVNDGSRDLSWQCIEEAADQNQSIRGLNFSRNFGKESAMYAGFCNTDGDYVAVMDADMQDPPSLLPEMLEILEDGEYDSVATRRVTRKGEPPIRSWFARRFYKLINRISDADVVDGARDFRLMKSDMKDAIVAMCEYNRFSKGIFGWIGFRTKWLEYENVERVAGETKWNFWKLFKYALDGIINFSETPMSIASGFGIFCTFVSFVMMLFFFIRKLVWGDPVAGWPSLVCIILFVAGLQFLCIGIMGKYIAKTYMETKNRPHYIISDTNKTDVNKIN